MYAVFLSLLLMLMPVLPLSASGSRHPYGGYHLTAACIIFHMLLLLLLLCSKHNLNFYLIIIHNIFVFSSLCLFAIIIFKIIFGRGIIFCLFHLTIG